MVTRLKFVIMCRNLQQELKSIDENVLAPDLAKGPLEDNHAIKIRMKVKMFEYIFLEMTKCGFNRLLYFQFFQIYFASILL